MTREHNLTAPQRERLLATSPMPPETYKAATLCVASNALNVQDCAELLEALGLTPQDGGADVVRALEAGL